MNNKPSSDKYTQYFVAAILTISAFLLLLKGAYGWGVVCLGLLLVLIKIDTLKSLTVGLKDGLRAEFDPKVTENIRENNEQVTPETYVTYRDIENRVIQEVKKRYGPDVTVATEYKLGNSYRADIYVNGPRKDDIYEIKLIRSKSSAQRIVANAVSQLQAYAAQLSKKPTMYLILATNQKIDLTKLHIPKDINVELFEI